MPRKHYAINKNEVDADQIWWIIENELQPLKKAIQEMIESLKRMLDE